MFDRWKKTKAQKKSTPQNEIDGNTGSEIERIACTWLKEQGLKQLTLNYLCRYGEIDIIMLDKQQLVFVEVRYRRHSSFGGAVASVDWRKQKKIQKTAAHYLMMNSQHANLSCRFDVIAAQANSNNVKIDWTWIKDAFIS